ncbi:MAG: hypothetical protein F6K55_33355 [Moorea sp. SIO4A3]|nr:hypothetical protein [Moorena sp. SIO4A3]
MRYGTDYPNSGYRENEGKPVPNAPYAPYAPYATPDSRLPTPDSRLAQEFFTRIFKICYNFKIFML